jgi:hypothetical protein
VVSHRFVELHSHVLEIRFDFEAIFGEFLGVLSLSGPIFSFLERLRLFF